MKNVKHYAVLGVIVGVVMGGWYFYNKDKNCLVPEPSNYLSRSYKNLNPLMTDFYQLTMSALYFSAGRKDEEATFYLHWRNPPFKGAYTLAAGLEGVIEFLERFRFSQKDINYLSSLKDANGSKMFKDDYLNYLKNMKLDVNIDALPEGTVMLGQGPVIRVQGPIIQCQILETALLTIMNSNSIVATRAARVSSLLAKNDAIAADFSLRRAPSLDLNVARSAYIGGFGSTSNVDAGRELGIPVVGTMAHSFVGSFQKPGISNSDVERAAFKEFLIQMPGNSILLVDTFDAKVGIANAIEMTKETKIPLMGVRIDSGDLYALTWHAFEKIEEAKQQHPSLFSKTQIYLTDGLDEYKLWDLFERSMKEKNKPFPAKRFGVGTQLGNPGPLSGGVYKLSAFRPDSKSPMVPTMKVAGEKKADQNIATGKTSLPGANLDTLRLMDEKGIIVAEVVVDGGEDAQLVLKEKKAVRIKTEKESLESIPNFQESYLLLKPVFKRSAKGEKAVFVYNSSRKLTDIKSYAQQQMKAMPEVLKSISAPGTIPFFVSPEIYKNMQKIVRKEIGAP